MLSAKEMYEFTKSRNEKLKDEKFAFVEKAIQDAANKEQFKVSFTFIQLKPFVGAIIEKLTAPELAYKVTQLGTQVVVSWDQKTEEVRRLVLSEDYDDDVDDHDDDDDPWQSSGAGC
jgi:hypothetical protein